MYSAQELFSIYFVMPDDESFVIHNAYVNKLLSYMEFQKYSNSKVIYIEYPDEVYSTTYPNHVKKTPADPKKFLWIKLKAKEI